MRGTVQIGGLRQIIQEEVTTGRKQLVDWLMDPFRAQIWVAGLNFAAGLGAWILSGSYSLLFPGIDAALDGGGSAVSHVKAQAAKRSRSPLKAKMENAKGALALAYSGVVGGVIGATTGIYAILESHAVDSLNTLLTATVGLVCSALGVHVIEKSEQREEAHHHEGPSHEGHSHEQKKGVFSRTWHFLTGPFRSHDHDHENNEHGHNGVLNLLHAKFHGWVAGAELVYGGVAEFAPRIAEVADGYLTTAMGVVTVALMSLLAKAPRKHLTELNNRGPRGAVGTVTLGQAFKELLLQERSPWAIRSIYFEEQRFGALENARTQAVPSLSPSNSLSSLQAKALEMRRNGLSPSVPFADSTLAR